MTPANCSSCCHNLATMPVVSLILIGLGAGVAGGIFGIGGGILIVPALVVFLGYSQKSAQAHPWWRC